MLKSICPRCGKLIPYGTTCECRIKDEHNRQKQYDTTRRNKESSAIYHSKEWSATRQAVIARDNGLCLLCLADKRIIPCDMVHHIVEVTEDKSKVYDTDNLVSLCNSCHAMVHREYKVDKNNAQKKLRKLVKMDR